MIATLLSLFIIGVIALVVLSVVLAIFGAFVSIAFLLLFKVVPILIIGYVFLRLLAPRRRQLSRADEEWLNT